jgi:putative ABC transport system substrate-binding protein
VAIIFNPETTAGRGAYYLPTFEAAARALGVEPVIAPVHDDVEIAAAITELARAPGGGLVVMNDGFIFVHRAQIMASASRNDVPAVYHDPIFAREGGLLDYGPERKDFFRRAAPYVDRILRGAKPQELPVQLPVKFEMAVNTRTARALGLTVPQGLLISADEVIE